MGCFGRDNEKQEKVKAEHQWSFINLSDFTASSFLTPLSYGVLYISLLISVACYVVDVFTCSQLLLFDKWSGQIQPAVPLYISRWVFTACILLSFALLAYRWWKALRAIRTGSITQSYLDPLAVRLQSVRVGRTGRGWRRFLVFAELTKSKKGVEYVALFTYFSFEAWARILFAEGPRQAINAVTLAAIMKADMVPIDDHGPKDGTSPVAQFFINFSRIADESKFRAAVLIGMLFTVIVWLFAFLSLVSACFMWLCTLSHKIPRSGATGLRQFCKRKVEAKLQSIVDTKVKKALAKEDMQRAKRAAKAGIARAGDLQPLLKRQPTLPVLEDDWDGSGGGKPGLSRQTTNATTVSTLPEYPGHATPTEPVPPLPSYAPFGARPPPARAATLASQRSYASSATGYPPRPYGPPGQPSGPQGPMSRSMTGSSSAHRPMPPLSRPGTAAVPLRVPVRQNTAPPPATGARYPPPSRGLSNMSARTAPQPGGRGTAPPPAGMRHYRGTSITSAGADAGPLRQPTLPNIPSGELGPYAASDYGPANGPPQQMMTPGGRFVPYQPHPAGPAVRPPPPASMMTQARNFSVPGNSSRGSSVYSMDVGGNGMAPPARPGAGPLHAGGSGSYDPAIVDAYARDSWRSAGAQQPLQQPQPGRAQTAERRAWF